MSPAGGLLGPPVASLVAAVDALPPGLAPQPSQQDGLHDGVNRDGADWGTFSNPCLDLFLADRSTPPQRLRDLLAAAWKRDANVTLKLICQMRDRDVDTTGKGDRESFCTAALWMHQAHPHTLAINLSAFAELGYLKDLPELLYRLVKGPNVRELEKAKAKAWLSANAEAEAKAAAAPTLTRPAGRKRSRTDDGDDPAPRASSSPLRLPSEPLVVADVAVRTKRSIKPDVVVPVDEAEEIQADDEQKAPVTRSMSKRVSKGAMNAAQALSMYNNDESYKRLFGCVADFFSERLQSDLDKLRANKNNQIGLAAKWCPSVDSAFNKATLLCEAIARRLFPWKDTNDEDGDRKMAYAALRRLRREVLVPLRKALQLPEVYISSQRWSEVPYDRVAQLAMKRYKEHFKKHDQIRFEAFMNKREAHRATHPPYKPIDLREQSLAEDAYTILPHTIISKITWRSQPGEGSVYYRFSWHALVNDLKRKGLFHNCVAVCDLSKRMKGTNRQVCLALGLLLAEVGFDDTPWKSSVRPFAMKPKSYFITKTSEAEQIAELDDLWSQCDDKIDLSAVFNHTLNGACQLSLGRDGAYELSLGRKVMARTIFVITDKEFDEAIARPWRKDYKAVCEKFTERGFGSIVPQVAFWNLGGRRSAALTETKDGVMKVSGFSDNFFRLFLKNGGIVTPEDEMHASIASDAYSHPIVVD